MKKKFKVLKYGNIFVDVSMLKEGIYATNIPQLYLQRETIEEIIGGYIGFKDDEAYFENEYFKRDLDNLLENLSKCKLVEVELIKL